jgi:mono/diheme cytochrome c family protein
MKSIKLIKMTSVVSLVLGGLTACGPSGNQPNVELLQDMMVQPAIKAQRYDDSIPFFKNGISEQVPPENTVPVGFTPYKYGFDEVKAGKELKNPYAGQMTQEVLSVGQKQYETQCMVCHGQMGLGGTTSVVGKKMPLVPPPLNSKKVIDWPDGTIYHKITMGQGIMGPYASHVPQSYRWQLVNYIRYLQKNQ